jgi:hypothetical protein
VTVPTDESVEDDIMHGYLFWTVTDRLGIRAAYEKKKLKREIIIAPEALSTQRIPIGISYHWQSGYFVDIEGNNVVQKITRNGVSDRDEFWNVDMMLGYRFHRRYGKAEIVIKNLLDEEFKYYDLSFHTNENMMPQFQPKRHLFFRFTLNF